MFDFVKDFNSLPERMPYGFWLASNGRILLVNRFAHTPVAREYIKQKYPDIVASGDYPMNMEYQVQRAMYSKGWCRGNFVRAEKEIWLLGGGDMNHKQKQAVQDLTDFYGLNRWRMVR